MPNSSLRTRLEGLCRGPYFEKHVADRYFEFSRRPCGLGYYTDEAASSYRVPVPHRDLAATMRKEVGTPNKQALVTKRVTAGRKDPLHLLTRPPRPNDIGHSTSASKLLRSRGSSA